MMTYNNEEFLLTDEDSFSQQSNNIKTWVFGRDREERSQIISTLKQEQWPIVSIQSLDYFDTLANQLSPDILILCSDIMSTSGNQLIKSIRRSGKIFPILCIGKALQADNCISALEDGADDYLHSPLNRRELISRAKRLAKLKSRPQPCGRQGTKASGNNLEYTICKLQFIPTTKVLRNKEGEEVSLTKGEVKMLTLLCTFKGETVSREKLGSLTQTESDTSRTIDVRISRIKKKLLILDPNKIYITSKRRQGYTITNDIQATESSL